jgi:hypothetical protein
MIKYKQDKKNIMANVLSLSYILLSTLSTKLLGFEYVKDLYIEDIDFGQVYIACEHSAFDKFYRFDEYLFKKKRLYVFNCSMHKLLVQKAHKAD